MCGLSAHVANWVVLGSFSPYPYSGNLLSHPFGFKVLLTLTLGFTDRISTRRSASKPSIESWARNSCPVSRTAGSPSYQGSLRCSLAYSLLQQFSSDVIDIAFAMSRRVSLPRPVCRLVNLLLGFHAVMLSDCNLPCVWICMSSLTTDESNALLISMSCYFILICKFLWNDLC